MNKVPNKASNITDIELQKWLLTTPCGREILHKERSFFLHNVGHIFGAYSIQIGLEQINLLQGNKIVNHYTINNNIISDLRFLALKENSIDLIICPHVLEYHQDYYYILAELYRVLTPNGKIILTCFNSQSWLKFFKNRIPALKNAELINLNKLKEQIRKLNFGICGGKFFSYTPPFNRASRLRKFRWLNQVGDRWFPHLSNSFALILQKDIITPTIIRPAEFDFKNKFEPQLGNAKICHKS